MTTRDLNELPEAFVNLYQGQWTSSRRYLAGSYIIFRGVTYRAWASTVLPPDHPGGPWERIDP